MALIVVACLAYPQYQMMWDMWNMSQTCASLKGGGKMIIYPPNNIGLKWLPWVAGTGSITFMPCIVREVPVEILDPVCF